MRDGITCSPPGSSSTSGRSARSTPRGVLPSSQRGWMSVRRIGISWRSGSIHRIAHKLSGDSPFVSTGVVSPARDPIDRDLLAVTIQAPLDSIVALLNRMTLPLGTASDAPVVLDLSTAEAHPTATVSLRDGALQGTTSAGAWSYAVYLPVLIHDPKEHDHVLKVSVELTVTAGRVGVGILNAAEDAFVTERHVPPAERVVTVELLAP